MKPITKTAVMRWQLFGKTLQMKYLEETVRGGGMHGQGFLLLEWKRRGGEHKQRRAERNEELRPEADECEEKADNETVKVTGHTALDITVETSERECQEGAEQVCDNV
jgi:hypothetical protein